MKFSFWNQYFEYKYTSNLQPSEVIDELENFYSAKKTNNVDKTANSLYVEKGSLWASFFCIGPETWCKNFIQIETESTPFGSEVTFYINLKLPGFTIGKNFLLEEAKKACNEI